MYSRILRVLIATLFAAAVANAAELTGVVKSSSGAPLAGVQILTYAPDTGTMMIGKMQMPVTSHRYEVKTDANGTFKIPSHGQVVFFERIDLRPLTKVMELSATKIEVTMEDGSSSLWKIPACSADEKSKRVGVGFMFDVPENILTRQDEGRFEHGGYFFGYRDGGKIDMMINSWESTSLTPFEPFILKLKEFSQRRWQSGAHWGYEFRGTLNDGKLWRWMSLKNGGITYQSTSKPAAEIFDKMIETVCFDSSAVTW